MLAIFVQDRCSCSLLCILVVSCLLGCLCICGLRQDDVWWIVDSANYFFPCWENHVCLICSNFPYSVDCRFAFWKILLPFLLCIFKGWWLLIRVVCSNRKIRVVYLRCRKVTVCKSFVCEDCDVVWLDLFSSFRLNHFIATKEDILKLRGCLSIDKDKVLVRSGLTLRGS